MKRYEDLLSDALKTMKVANEQEYNLLVQQIQEIKNGNYIYEVARYEDLSYLLKDTELFMNCLLSITMCSAKLGCLNDL